jgi:hypothetical protein
LTGKEQHTEKRMLYWEFPNNSQSVRWGNWKAIRPKWNAKLELYDLSKDISEKNDVAAQNPAVIEAIENYMKTARTESENWPTTKR